MEKQAYLIFLVYAWVWDGGLGVDGGWMRLPTRPQRYCEFVTPRHLFPFLVFFFIRNESSFFQNKDWLSPYS